MRILINFTSAFMAFSFMFASSQPALAETTPWISVREMNRYLKEKLNNGEIIPTSIQCRAATDQEQVRFVYKRPSAAAKPFYKWNWLVSSPAELNKSIAALKRSDRRGLRYRPIATDNFIDRKGRKRVCAIVYR